MERTRRAVLVGTDTARLLALAGELEARGLEVALYRDAERGLEACASGECDVLVAIGRLAPRDGVPPQRVSVPLVLLDAPDAPDLPLRPIGPRTALGATVLPSAAAERVLGLLARAPEPAATAPRPAPPAAAAASPAPPAAPSMPPPSAPPPPVAIPGDTTSAAAPGTSTSPAGTTRETPGTAGSGSAAGLAGALGTALSSPATTPPPRAQPYEPAARETEAPQALPPEPEPARGPPAERATVPPPAARAEPAPASAAGSTTPPAAPAPSGPAADAGSTAVPWWEEPSDEAAPAPGPAAAPRGGAERITTPRRAGTEADDASHESAGRGRGATGSAAPRSRVPSNLLLLVAGLALGLAIGFVVLGLFGVR